MKLRTFILLIFAVMLMAAYSSVVAQDEMPPMGAPDEIKALNWLVGEWDVDAEFLVSQEGDWDKSKATAIYSFSVDGCILEMAYTGNMMGMDFVGKLVETYDRKNKEYQSIWVDNMGARISYYTGNKVADTTILSGTDLMPDGSEAMSRILTFNETEKTFDWQYDLSTDGGKTYSIVGRAKYTKK